MTRKVAVVLALAALLGVLGAADIATGATRTMYVHDDFFSRSATRFTAAKITVRQNDTVRWRWVGEDLHNVRVRIGRRSHGSDYQQRGTWRKRFTRRGKFTALCDLHATRMRMTVTVR